MTEIHTYRVAGWRFEVLLPVTADANRLLPSFVPFRHEGAAEADDCLFRFTVQGASLPDGEPGAVLEESENDLGHVLVKRAGTGYRVELKRPGGTAVHVMLADSSFARIQACLQWEDPAVDYALGSLLRIAFSQAVLLHGGVALHAAAVVYAGRACLFMGRSGTGKSTHAAAWQRCLPDCRLLNDDNPVVRLQGDEVWAYGTPWSGKTPCYKNLGYPVAGIVRLYQAPCNRFRRLADVDSFVALLPGCFAVRADVRLYDALCDTLVAIGSRVTVGQLHCLPDEEAVRVCYEGIIQTNNK